MDCYHPHPHQMHNNKRLLSKNDESFLISLDLLKKKC